MRAAFLAAHIVTGAAALALGAVALLACAGRRRGNHS